MLIDHLDSPTMMNCRQTSRTFLDVVEGNRHLWNYYYSPGYDFEPNLNMLNFFSFKSDYSLKAFHFVQRVTSTSTTEAPNDYTRRYENAKAVIKVILRSKKSFRSFSCVFNEDVSSLYDESLRESMEFPNLKSFCFLPSWFYPVVWVRQSEDFRGRIPSIQSSRSHPSLTRLRVSGNSRREPQMRLLRASRSTIIHLEINDFSEAHTMLLPKLQVLNLSRYFNRAFLGWSCSSLKVLILRLSFDPETVIVKDFPQSLEHLWLTTNLKSFLRREGLESLGKYYPKLETFTINVGVEFYPEEVIKMVEARKTAVAMGSKMDGVEMKSIRKLTLGWDQLDSFSLSKLQELVPEVVDARSASREVTIDC